MSSQKGDTAPSKEVKESSLKSFLAKLRKRHIIETLAAFIGGGWLLLEFVDRLLVAHYHFPDETIDLTFIAILAAMLCTIMWRWFSGIEKRPGNVKVEVLLVPLIILTTLAINLNLVFNIAGISGMKLLTGIIALCLGIAWVIFKLYQWAAIAPSSTPGLAKKEKKFALSAAPAASKSEKSIVVLPFADLSPQKDQEYFCDGMTEEIITHLSHVHPLRVISRNSAMMFKGTPKDTGTIGRELSVQYVLEGSVRKAGNDLRITAQLIDAKSDAHLWAEKYNGTLEDVFDLQERLARRIVETLKVTLTTDEERRLAARPIADLRAYDTWLRAREACLTFTKDGIERAILLTNEALSIVGDNALLYATLGFIYYASYDFGISYEEETLDRGEKYAAKALELDPDLGQALYAMGVIRYKRGDLKAFVRYARRSIERHPESDASSYLAFILAEVGKTVEARGYADEAVAQDPLKFITRWARAAVDVFDGRFDEALERFRDTEKRLAPREAIFIWWFAQAAAYRGDEQEALRIFEQVKTLGADLLSDFSELFQRALRGDGRGVKEVLERTALRQVAKTDEYFPVFLANSLALVGEMKEALDWIEQAISWGFSNHRFLSPIQPVFCSPPWRSAL